MLFIILAILVLLICVTFLRNIYNRVVNIGDQLNQLVKNYEQKDSKETEIRASESEPSGESTTKTTG